MDVDSETLPATHRMGEKLTSPEGRGLYAKRNCFQRRPTDGSRRYWASGGSASGVEKVRGEWDLVCLSLDVKRMAALTMC